MVFRPSSGRPFARSFQKNLLPERLVTQGQILHVCETFKETETETLFRVSGSHDLDSRHAHIWYKAFKIFSRTKRHMTLKPDIYHWGTGPIIVCSNDNPRLTFKCPIYGNVEFGFLCFYMGTQLFNGRNLLELARVTI